MTAGVFLGSIAAMSINSWPLVWLGFELNLINFVPTFIKEENKKKPAIMYFIVQRVGSIVILRRSIVTESKVALCLFILIGLLIKLGAAPFHFWLPRVLTQLNTPGLYIIITWQKLAPLWVAIMLIITKTFISFLNLLVGSFIMTVITRPIMVIIFSGISQLGWILIIQTKVLTTFILIYYIILLPIIFYLNTNTKNFFWGIMNAGGLPPFSGFMIKIKALTRIKKVTAFIFVSARAVALSCYSRIMINSNYRRESLSMLTYTSLIVGIV